jgi:hypothetical protein
VNGFLPPEAARIASRIVARNGRRARLVIDGLSPSASGWRKEALAALEATLRTTRGASRAGFLSGPDLRAWLNQAEEALEISDASVADEVRFDRIARGPHLAEVVPSGRMDRDFRRRATALGHRLRESAFIRLAPLLAFMTPPQDRYGPFPLDLTPDGEEARREGELHLFRPVATTLSLEPGARLELAWGGIRVIQQGVKPRLLKRQTIGDSDIVLARRVVSTRRGLRPGADVTGLQRRLGRALALICDAWKPAYREVIQQTRVVVPLVERGTVSFSLPDRPGVSYINVWNKSLVDLADDLVHETAHHLLHGLEELSRLDRDDGEPRYWSPWRRSLRPLRGILHAAYTFAWRAELLSRLLRLRAKGPPRKELASRALRQWMLNELDFEVDALRKSSEALADAECRGLLTPSGVRLARWLGRRIGRIS